jgi:hypothetical protein
VSLPALEWAWCIQASPTQKLVALALADHANDERECWPSIARIAQRTGLSKTAIKEAMTALERTQLITRTRDAGRQTRYRLNMLNGQPTRPADGLGRQTARSGDGPTRPPGDPELGRQAATNRKEPYSVPSERAPNGAERGVPEQPSPKTAIWNLGESMLGSRSAIGKLIKTHGEASVFHAIAEAASHEAADPRAYIHGLLKVHGHETSKRTGATSAAERGERFGAECWDRIHGSALGG